MLARYQQHTNLFRYRLMINKKITNTPIQYQIVNDFEITVYFAVIQAVFLVQAVTAFLH